MRLSTELYVRNVCRKAINGCFSIDLPGPIIFCLLCLCFLQTNAQNSIPPIGEWRDHFSYLRTNGVVKGDKIYCAAYTGVFSIDNKNEAGHFSKVNALHDVAIQCIDWDAATQQLVIAYTNSNLDILKNDRAKNIGDIQRSSLSGNKSIRSIYCRAGLAYLSSGLGIIVADLNRYEIKDTWFIGNNGTQININAFTADASAFYAATEEGLKTIPSANPNPSNYANWQNLSGTNGLTAGPVKNVVFSNGKIIAEKNDSLFVLNANGWSLYYNDTNWQITQTNSSENKIMLCQKNALGNRRVLVLGANAQIEKTITDTKLLLSPAAALSDNNQVWIADLTSGLSRFGSSTDRFVPNGPSGTAYGEMVAQNNLLLASAGSVNSQWVKQNNSNGLFYFEQDLWTTKNKNTDPLLDSTLDFITAAIDPVNNAVWAGSYGGGLVNIPAGGIPKLYKKGNSTLQSAIGDPASIRVSGLAFDHMNNLWVSNYGATQNLHVRKTDSSWKAIGIPFVHAENAVSQIVVDELNQLWIVSPKSNGLFCYDYNKTTDNISDDRWKFYRQGTGNGNLPTNNVLCIAKDKNNFIWVGTDRGIGIIQCTNTVFSAQGCEAILPVVQLDNFAGLLFKDEMVQAIAVDGANRKWVGTKNGVWLLSPAGDKIIYRYTQDNSPLPDNDVKRISIDPNTGEVFMSTFYGICSFRSTATEGKKENENVLVFPNPVPPGYGGTIAIRGLVNNALVKIAELSGRLVFQTRALGGQAIWNGRNYNGEKVASGVYLVIVRDDSGEEKLVTKIVIVSGR